MLTQCYNFTDDIRKQVWPLLLELNLDDLEPYSENVEYSHVEFSQVVLDVNRSIKRFPPAIPSDQRVAMQDQLIRLILKIITKHPQLQYYQVQTNIFVLFLKVPNGRFKSVTVHCVEKFETRFSENFGYGN